MKVKVYVNYYDREVINEKAFNERIKEATNDYEEDECFFDEWLEEHYSASEIWKLNEEQRKEVRSDFLIKCEELAVEDVRDDWAEEEIEV